jgi:hypothetical protein
MILPSLSWRYHIYPILRVLRAKNQRLNKGGAPENAPVDNLGIFCGNLLTKQFIANRINPNYRAFLMIPIILVLFNVGFHQTFGLNSYP